MILSSPSECMSQGIKATLLSLNNHGEWEACPEDMTLQRRLVIN